MENIVPIIQVVVALGLLNVWIIRSKKVTAYRGGSARNMREEFAVYGLPYWFMVLVGALKIGIAVLLIAGIWIPYVAQFSAAVLAVLMSGAVIMHIKVKDPFKKMLPALTMLILSALIVLLS